MYIVITKEDTPRVFLMKATTEQYNKMLKALGVEDYDSHLICDADIATINNNRTVILEL